MKQGRIGGPLLWQQGSPRATATLTLEIAESMHQGPLGLLPLPLTVYQAQASQPLYVTF